MLAAYNTKHKGMNLVFFEDALEHITRIERTLRLPQVMHAPAWCAWLHALSNIHLAGQSSQHWP